MRLLLVAAALQVGAFTPSGDGRPPSRLRAEGDAKPKDPIVSAAPAARVKALLDRLPVFTVANEQGQPLQYEADGKPLALLYADVDAAKSELKSAKEEHPSLGLDIVPMGLGEAFQLHRTGAAVLIPSQDSMEAAGAPKGASPLGQELPLFACMEMAVQGEDGKPVLPLFLDRGRGPAGRRGRDGGRRRRREARDCWACRCTRRSSSSFPRSLRRSRSCRPHRRSRTSRVIWKIRAASA